MSKRRWDSEVGRSGALSVVGEDPKVLSKNSETEEFLSEEGEILLNKISFPSVEREERMIIEQKLASKTGKEVLSEEREDFKDENNRDRSKSREVLSEMGEDFCEVLKVKILESAESIPHGCEALKQAKD